MDPYLYFGYAVLMAAAFAWQQQEDRKAEQLKFEKEVWEMEHDEKFQKMREYRKLHNIPER